MSGFFDSEEVKSNKIAGKGSCAKCGLYKKVTSPVMEPYGNFKLGIMNIGEAPGETEDKKGIPWQGKAGRRLKKEYRKVGIDLFEDCININAVSCRPVDKKGLNRNPTNTEIQCCQSKVLQMIEKYDPKVIVLFGNIPIQSVIGSRIKKNLGGVTKWRGARIPDRDFKSWICPTFHPSFIEYTNEAPEITLAWNQDLTEVARLTKEIVKPSKLETEDKICILDEKEAKEYLKQVLQETPDLLAFDYETTGKKPHAPGHQIVCLSMCCDFDKAVAFTTPKTPSGKALLKKVLTNPIIGKIAQNMKFEMAWTHQFFGYDVQGWVWDTMIASHVLDNRKGTTGLKHQTYTCFGIAGYDDDVAPYLKAQDPKNSNSFNKIVEFYYKQIENKNKILTYCAKDSLFTYRLAKRQMMAFGVIDHV